MYNHRHFYEMFCYLFELICFSWYFVGTAGIFSIFSIIFITESWLASHCPPVSKSVSGWFLSDKSSDFHWTSEQHHDAAAASCIVSVFLLVPDLEICITWNHLSIYTWLGWVTRLLMQGWVNCTKKLLGWADCAKKFLVGQAARMQRVKKFLGGAHCIEKPVCWFEWVFQLLFSSHSDVSVPWWSHAEIPFRFPLFKEVS